MLLKSDIRLHVKAALLLGSMFVFWNFGSRNPYEPPSPGILDPPQIQLSAVVSESAPGEADGAILITVTVPGVEPYVVLLNEIIWGDLVSGSEIAITGLVAGPYTVQIYGFDGLTSNILEVIVPLNVVNDPADIYLGTLQAESAPGANDGAMVIHFTTPPEHPPYEIFLNDILNGTTEGDFVIGNLSAGEYSVYVVDVDGVQSNTLLVTIPLNIPVPRLTNLSFEPILSESGPGFPPQTHAWLTGYLLDSEDLEFFNARVILPDTNYWVVRNVPLPPFNSTQKMSYRINTEQFDPNLPITIEYHVGPEWFSTDVFPATTTVDLLPMPVTYFVPSGSDDIVFLHSILIPPIFFPPIFPGSFDWHYRGCDVPNIDLDNSAFHPANVPVPNDLNACGPAAAGNSLHWLVQQHPELMGDTTSLRSKVDSLKKYMSMAKDDPNGVRFDSMVVGKLTLIDQLQLPIRVKYKTKHESGNTDEPLASLDPRYGHVADNQGALGVYPDFEWFKSEMNDGEDVEVHVGWYGEPDINGDRARNGGHWLVATGYFEADSTRGVWLKDDADQTTADSNGLRHEYYEWDTLPGGIPYLKNLTDSDGRVAIVESLVSESYDPDVTFVDLTDFDWTYKPVIYTSGDLLEGFPFHAFLDYTLPDHSDFRFLNARVRNPDNGMEEWILKNVPLPAATFPRPQVYRMNLKSIVNTTSLPSTIELYFKVGDFYTDSQFPVQGLSVLTASPVEHHIPRGAYLTFHPLIPAFPPIITPPIPPIFPFPSEYRGCEVPNIDLDSTANPVDPLIPGSSDWNACGPAAAANSLQWLDDEHPEIDIPIELRGILDSLKLMMHKIDSLGVSWDTMIMAKLEFIDKYQLPIHVKYQTHRPRPENQPSIPSPDPTYGHHADNETDPVTSIPDFDWLMQEMEAGENVEVIYGFYCDTTIIVPATDTTPEMSMIKRNYKYGHAINLTGYIEAGSLQGIAFKHDRDQRNPGGTVEEYAQWCLDSLNYPFLKELSSDTCHAYIENIISESYDPSVIFCPIKVCIPDDNGEGSLREALACAEPGSTITLGAELANDTIHLTSGPLIIDRNLSIYRTDQNPSWGFYIEGESVSRVFEIMPGVTVTIDGLNIICGEATEASCVSNAGTVIFRDTQFYNHDGLPGTASQIINTGTIKIEGNTNLKID